MLAFDFDYFKPLTIQEAVVLFQTLDRQGKQPMYFSGGTELITLGRLNLAYTEAVIDIKEIPALHDARWSHDQLVLGSALSLTKIAEMNFFPLLTQVAVGVADHTARGKITLGGNVCAQIFYREATLPFLLGNSDVMIAGPEGLKRLSFDELFFEQFRLGKGELLVQLIADRKLIEAPFFAIKRRQQWETGYPLLSMAAVKIDGMIRVAISGLCPYPFRADKAEVFLNNSLLPVAERIILALGVLPAPILNDVEGSADYRLFVLRNLFEDVLVHFEGVEGV